MSYLTKIIHDRKSFKLSGFNRGALCLWVLCFLSPIAQADPLSLKPLRSMSDPFWDVSGAPRAGSNVQAKSYSSPFSSFFCENQKIDWGGDRILPRWYRRAALPTPPADSSERTKKELLYLLAIAEKRDPQYLAAIRETQIFDWRMVARPVIGEHLAPKTGVMMEVARLELLNIVIELKNGFLRTRPTVLEPKLTATIQIPDSSAYPSGHGTVAFVTAFLLSELAPHHTEELIQRAFVLGWLREMAGIHFPSDLSAGVLLARQLSDQLLMSKRFQKVLQDAREELKTLSEGE